MLLPQPIRAASHDRVNAEPSIKRSCREDGRISGTPLDIKAPLHVRGQLIQHLGSKNKSGTQSVYEIPLATTAFLCAQRWSCSSCSPAALMSPRHTDSEQDVTNPTPHTALSPVPIDSSVYSTHDQLSRQCMPVLHMQLDFALSWAAGTHANASRKHGNAPRLQRWSVLGDNWES